MKKMSKYLNLLNFNPWNKHLGDCAVRAIVAATGLSYEEVCRRLKVKWKKNYGLVRDTGIDLSDIKTKFNDFFDIVEDFYDNMSFVPDEFKGSETASEIDLIDASLGVDQVTNDTLEDFIETYSDQGVFLVSLVGNPKAEDPTAREGGHIVAVFLNRGKKHFFVDTWSSEEMRVDAFMRVKKREPADSPLHFKRYWKITRKQPMNESNPSSKPSVKKFRKDLAKHVMQFTYKKRSGKIRKAEGTMSPHFLPKEVRDYKKKTKRTAPADSIVYYDFGKKMIRSFKDWCLMKSRVKK